MTYYDINVDGSIGLPLSTFVFDLNNQMTILNDSTQTRSAFNYSKGSFGLHDLSIKTNSKTLNNGIITAFAHTRSYNGADVYIGDGSIMQSYLVNFKNNSIKNTDFSITSAYHNEAMNMPVGESNFIEKSNESYFYGISFKYLMKYITLRFNSNIQISDTKIDFERDEDWIENSEISLSFKSPYLNPFLTLTESNNTDFIRLGFSNNELEPSFKINFVYVDDFNIEFNLKKKLNDFIIRLEREIINDYSYIDTIYIKNSFALNYLKNSFNVSILPILINTSEDSWKSLLLKLKYDSKILFTDLSLNLYDNGIYPVDYFFNSDLGIKFPFFNRYTPYLKFYYSIMGSSQSVFPNGGGSLISFYFDSRKNQSQKLDFTIGVNLRNFKLSYNIYNIFEESMSLTQNYESTPIHNFLKVEWSLIIN